MSRTALQSIAAVVIGILVVGVAAATITAPLDTSTPNVDVRNPQANGSGSFWDFELDSNPNNGNEGGGASTGRPDLFAGQCVPFLLTPWFYALAGLGFVALFLFVRWRVSTAIGAIAVVAVLPWVIIGHSWFTVCQPPDPEGGGFGFEYIAEDNDSVGRVIEAAGESSPIPPEFVGGLLILAVVLLPVVAFLGLRSRRREDDTELQGDAAHEKPLSGVAQVAGRAADRIEGSVGDVDNEVFRAWKRMTEYVDVPEPKSSTPAEFARAARDAGMAEEDVALLTDLFRAIRYGGEAPTRDREQQAVEALREIEAEYGDGGDEE